MKLGYVKDGASHKKIDNLWCKESGAWKQVDAAWIKTASGWTQWYDSATEPPPPEVTIPPTLALSDTATNNSGVEVRLHSDGTTSRLRLGVGPNWASPTTAGIGDHYYIRVSGDATNVTGDPFDQWLDLSVMRFWGVTANDAIRNLSFVIADTPGGAALCNGTIALTNIGF